MRPILNNLFPLFFCILLLPRLSCAAQTLEEKREELRMQQGGEAEGISLAELNGELRRLRRGLQEKYALADEYRKNEKGAEAFQHLLEEINRIRSEITAMEKSWREIASLRAEDEENGALWDQEETTLSQLIVEYGSNDYLYVIPAEIASMRLYIHSAIPIPRASWSALLEMILSHNGIGIETLNPYARQLYLLKSHPYAIDRILTSPDQLQAIPEKERIIYLFSPPPERMREVRQFFERFRNPKTTSIHPLGYKIAIISSKEEVEKHLSLYEAIWKKEREKIAKILPLMQIKPHKMEKILSAYFRDLMRKPQHRTHEEKMDELELFPLEEEGALVLIGPKEIVERGEKVVRETEKQVKNPAEMSVYWYTCRYSDPIDIAEALEKVYDSLVGAKVERAEPAENPTPSSAQMAEEESLPYTVHPLPALATAIQMERAPTQTTHFIPYPKTGSIMIVVRRDSLAKVKELIEKIDIPKKMVQIEVLLLEKKISHTNNFGLNILKLGSSATNEHETGMRYDHRASGSRGILDFFISRKKPNPTWPAFDIAYRFLMAQEDIRINAAPSITTLNQTPAQISLVQELSIENGAAPIDSNKGIVFQKSFSRAQYGTTLVITPTIHEPLSSDGEGPSVTLETNITFDTIKKTDTAADRPQVSRRHIKNCVCVKNGETAILGGLREKMAEDASRKLPILGEIPGIGKLFGDSQMIDERTEMFIFITPKVLSERGAWERAQHEQLCKRPGDLPEFIERIQRAKERERRGLFTNSVKLLFGTIDDRPG